MTGQIQPAGPVAAHTHAPAQAPTTLRYRAPGAIPLGACPETYIPAAPDRRWARILRAVRAAPINTAAVHRLVGRLDGTRKARRADEFKTLRSVGGLIRCGLLAHTGHGLIATPEGLDILARAERAAGWPVITTPETEGTPSHD